MFCCWIFVALTVVLYYILRYLWELITVGELSKRAVFITGCDSGFGKQLALRCARNGIPVFAGCLTQKGVNSLKQEADEVMGRLKPLQVDVTRDDSVIEAKNFVEKNLTDGMKLWAIVNNAGVFSCYGPDDWCRVEDYQSSMDVNFLGIVRVTQAFKPLLKKSKGRIISTSSVAGRIAFMGGGPYAAAKYAVEAYMDTIRQELRIFGVDCSILEPGIFKTDLIDKDAMKRRVEHVWNRMSDEQRQEYGEEYKEYFIWAWNDAMHRLGSEQTEHVVDNYYHAITARFPRCRYRCGWDSLLVYIPLTYLPTEVIDAVLRMLARQKVFPDAVVGKKNA